MPRTYLAVRLHPPAPDCDGILEATTPEQERQLEQATSCPTCGRARLVSLPRRRDDHSASRRVGVLELEAPHLIAPSYRRGRWLLRAVLSGTLAIDALLAGVALLAFHLPRAAHFALAIGGLLAFIAAIAGVVTARGDRR